MFVANLRSHNVQRRSLYVGCQSIFEQALQFRVKRRFVRRRQLTRVPYFGICGTCSCDKVTFGTWLSRIAILGQNQQLFMEACSARLSHPLRFGPASTLQHVFGARLAATVACHANANSVMRGWSQSHRVSARWTRFTSLASYSVAYKSLLAMARTSHCIIQ